MLPPYRSYVLVSRQQIAQNYRNVRAVVGPEVEVMGVVKADAYGHGALEVARALAAEGARWLAVSSVDEGVHLRNGGLHETRILVMGGFLPYEGEALVEYNLTPAIHSLAQLNDLDRLAQVAGRPLPFHLKIDSGMNRLGTRATAREIVDALGAARHAPLEGLMTHLASAADYSSRQTADQLSGFHAICRELSEAGIKARWTHAD